MQPFINVFNFFTSGKVLVVMGLITALIIVYRLLGKVAMVRGSRFLRVLLRIGLITGIGFVIFYRNDKDIYEDFFGRGSNCLQVTNTQVEFYNTYIGFSACPNEMKRIIKKYPFEFEVINSEYAGSYANDWFHPESLGKTLIRGTFRPDEFSSKHGIDLFISNDSTKAYMVSY